MQSCGVFKFTKQKKQNAFFHCLTSNSIVKLNISKDTSKKHEKPKVKKTRKKYDSLLCIVFLLKSLVWKNTEEWKKVVLYESDSFLTL